MLEGMIGDLDSQLQRELRSVSSVGSREGVNNSVNKQPKADPLDYCARRYYWPKPKDALVVLRSAVTLCEGW